MTQFLDRLRVAFAAKYTIEEEVGRGGMATVYRADDFRRRRKVAVKVLRPELAEGIAAERFLREIEIAAGLSHPNILPLYDSGEARRALATAEQLAAEGSEARRSELDEVRLKLAR